jgi:hypothetical protein
MRAFQIFGVFVLAAFVGGCQSPRYSAVTFHRALPDVVAAIQESCVRSGAYTQRPGVPWITGTNEVPDVSFAISMQDHFTSFPVGVTSIFAMRMSSDETELRVTSIEPTSLRWQRRHKVETQKIAEIAQILGE